MIKLFSTLPMRKKILLYFTMIILFSLVAMAYFANTISTKAIVDQAKRNSISGLALIERNLLSLVTKTEDYARILSLDDQLQDGLLSYESIKNKSFDERDVTPDIVGINQKLSESLNRIVASNRNLAEAAVLSSDGKFFDVGAAENSKLYGVFNKIFINEIAEKRVPVWSDLLKLDIKGGFPENVFPVCKLVIGINSGRKAGFIVLYVKESDISSFYYINNTNVNSQFYIVNNKGMIVSSKNKAYLFKNFKKFIEASYHFGNYQIKEGCTIYKINNRQLLFNAMSFEKFGWKIVNIVPMDELTKENININKMIVVIGVICLLLSFIAVYTVSRSISKPVLKLADAMKRVEEGDLNVRFGILSGDELGILQRGFNNLMDRIQGLISDVYKEQKLMRELEFKLLQSQIKPHFLYNSLETILSLVKLGRYNDTIETTKYLAGYYRLSLSKGDDIIRISDELQLAGNYLFIQRIRYPQFINYTMDFPDYLLKYKIPKLTLQPLVENSIYHGLKTKGESGRIELTGELVEDRIVIVVYDNGTGMEEEEIRKILSEKPSDSKKTSFGLSSVNKRIKLIYGDEYGLSLESEPGSFTRVTISIPAME